MMNAVPIRILSIAETEAERLTARDGIARVVVAEGYKPPDIPTSGINFHVLVDAELARASQGNLDRVPGLVGTVVYETAGLKGGAA